MTFLERKRVLMNGHRKIIDGNISKVNALEKNGKQSVKNKDNDYEFDLYESYVNTDDAHLAEINRIHCVRKNQELKNQTRSQV